MTGGLVILAALVVVGLLLWLHDRRHPQQGEVSELPGDDSAAASAAPVAESGAEGSGDMCCGRHAVCERTSLTPLGDEAEYYDDHELDRFKGRDPSDYTAEESEEFEDVLLTMLPEDVAGWSRSLQVRGVEPPVHVRDQILMIVAEQRASN